MTSEALEVQASRIVAPLLSLSGPKREYVECLQWGEFHPGLIGIEPPELVERLRMHPALLWKIRSAKTRPRRGGGPGSAHRREQRPLPRARPVRRCPADRGERAGLDREITFAFGIGREPDGEPATTGEITCVAIDASWHSIALPQEWRDRMLDASDPPWSLP